MQNDQSSLGSLWVAEDPKLLYQYSEDLDQTAWMHRPIYWRLRWVLSDFASFVMFRCTASRIVPIMSKVGCSSSINVPLHSYH